MVSLRQRRRPDSSDEKRSGLPGRRTSTYGKNSSFEVKRAGSQDHQFDPTNAMLNRHLDSRITGQPEYSRLKPTAGPLRSHQDVQTNPDKPPKLSKNDEAEKPPYATARSSREEYHPSRNEKKGGDQEANSGQASSTQQRIPTPPPSSRSLPQGCDEHQHRATRHTQTSHRQTDNNLTDTAVGNSMWMCCTHFPLNELDYQTCDECESDRPRPLEISRDRNHWICRDRLHKVTTPDSEESCHECGHQWCGLACQRVWICCQHLPTFPAGTRSCPCGARLSIVRRSSREQTICFSRRHKITTAADLGRCSRCRHTKCGNCDTLGPRVR